jgi:hypothetical protein
MTSIPTQRFINNDGQEVSEEEAIRINEAYLEDDADTEPLPEKIEETPVVQEPHPQRPVDNTPSDRVEFKLTGELLPESERSEIRRVPQSVDQDADIEDMFNRLAPTDEMEGEDGLDQNQKGEKVIEDTKKESAEIEKLFASVEAPPPPATEDGKKKEDPGFFALSELKSAASAAAKGVLKATEDLGNGALDLANLAEDFFAERGYGDGKWIDESSKLNWVTPPKNTGDAIVFMAARYLTPFGLMTKGLNALGLAGKAATASGWVGSGAMTALTTDPDEKGLADVVNAVPELAWMMPDILTSKDDDTRLQRRLKRAGEDMLLGGAAIALTEGIGRSVLKVREYKKAKEVAKKVADVASDATPVEKKAAAIKQIAPEVTVSPAKVVRNEKVGAVLNKSTLTADALDPIAEADIATAFDFENNKVMREAWVAMKEGVIPVADARVRGAALIDTPEKVDQFLAGIKKNPGQALNGDQVSALTQLMNRSRMKVFLESINDVSKMTDDQVIEFAKINSELVEVATILKGGVSHSARGLRYAQEAFQSGSDAKKAAMVDEFLKLSGEEVKQQAKYIKASLELGKNIPELMASVIPKARTHRASELFYSAWINGALSSVNTFFTNMLGSTSMVMLHPLETAVGAMIPGSNIKFNEVHALYEGQAMSLFEAFGTAKDVFKSLEMPAGYASNFDFKGPIFKTEMGGWMGKVLNAVGAGVEFPTRATTATDAFFKVMAGRMRQHQYARRLANISDGGTEMYEKILKNMPADLEQASVLFANKQTFAAPLDDVVFGELGQGVIKLADWVPFGLGRVFIPFTKTVTNLADTTFRYSPLAALSPRIRADLLAGGVRATEAQARVAIGTGVLALGGILGAMGVVRGKGGTDFYSKRALQGKDMPPDDSIAGVPISTLQPFSNLVLMGAEIAEIGKYMWDSEDDDKYTQAVAEFGLVLADRFTPDYLTGSAKEFLVGLSDIQTGKTKSNKVAEGAAQVLETAMPYRWTYRNFGKVLRDPVKRDTTADADMEFMQSVFTQFKNRLFDNLGWGKDLPKQLNIFGEEIATPPGFTNSMVSAFFTNKEPDAVLMGLRKLGLDTPNIGEVPPEEMDFKIRMPSRSIDKVSRGKQVAYKMSPKEYEKFIGYMNADFRGQTLKQEVADILSTDISDELKKLQIKEAMKNAKSRAKLMMMQEVPDILDNYERVDQNRQNKIIGVEQ